MDVIECIKTRRSIRNYSDKKIEKEDINKLIESAIWAPSGKNGQPWKFKVITEEEQINKLSELSSYIKWIRTAPCFILIFLDKDKSYNYIKDVQSCGAAIQNIILSAHFLGIGSCWIGEILGKADLIKKELLIENDNLELMGLVTLGYKSLESVNVIRNDINSFLI